MNQNNNDKPLTEEQISARCKIEVTDEEFKTFQKTYDDQTEILKKVWKVLYEASCEKFLKTDEGKKGDRKYFCTKVCCEMLDLCPPFYKQNWFYYACGGAGLLILIIVIIVIACCCCKKRGGGGKDGIESNEKTDDTDGY